MRERNKQAFQRKKEEIMEACFNCYAENGLTGTGIQALADACLDDKASWKNPADVSGIPCDGITPLICIFVRARVHDSLFVDEFFCCGRPR